MAAGEEVRGALDGVGRRRVGGQEAPEFLAALGADGGPAQEELLRQELDCLAHPRARVAAARQEPVDTLVQFLADTRLAVPGGALEAFRTRLAEQTGRGSEGYSESRSEDVEQDASPRDTVLAAVTALFGEPAEALAAWLELLVEHRGHDGRRLDGSVVGRLYREAGELCQVWTLALDEDLGHTGASDRTVAYDEVYATEGAVLGRFSSPCPPEERLELADLVRQTTELIVLDRCGLAVFPFGPHHCPSLGWPTVLAQFQYRLRQLAAGAGAVGVLLEAEPDGPERPVDGSSRRYGQALHLLAAGRGAPPDDEGATGTGLQRIRRSPDELMGYPTSLQLADLAHALRRRPELTAELGLGPAAAAEAVAAELTLLLRGRGSRWPVPDPARLPLSAWELRERFPGVDRLLRCYRDVMSRKAYGSYAYSRTPDSLVSAVCAAWVEGEAGPGRSIAALCGEIAALSTLFTGDDQVDRAIALLGAGPRDVDVYWDQLSWHSWLRAAAAELTWHAEQLKKDTPGAGFT